MACEAAPQQISICLFQRCTPRGKSERLVGERPTSTIIHCADVSGLSFLLNYLLVSVRKCLQFHSNWEQKPGFYPGSPASPDKASLYALSSKSLSAFIVYSIYQITIKASCVSFSVLSQNLVHPKPDADWDAVGERHPQPLPVCGDHHTGAHLRLSEA